MMWWNMIPRLLFALVPLHECARINRGSTARADTQNATLADDCAYPESLGFEVGDKVRIYKPAAGFHNYISMVGCPEHTPGTEGRLCLVEKGCFLPDNLRHLSSMDIVLVNLQTRTSQFALGCAEKVAEYWPTVQESLAVFARITLEQLGVVGATCLAAVNPCDPEVRRTVAATLATIQSHITWMADAAVKRWPYVRPKLVSVARMTAAGLASLGRLLGKAATSAAEKLEVEEVLRDVSASVASLVSGALDQHPKVASVAASIGEYANRIGELSAKAAILPVDAYRDERVQATLAMVQAGAGQLMAAAAARWPDVRRALGKAAALGASAIQALGLRAFEAVNLCNPEKRAQAQAAFEIVQSRVQDLASAVAEHWPTVKRGLMDLVESMSATAHMLSEKLAVLVQDAWKRKEVQNILADIQAKVAQVQAMVAEKTSATQAKAQALAELIKEKVQTLVQEVTHGESTNVADDEDIAEL